jgi:hypothetical protein
VPLVAPIALSTTIDLGFRIMFAVCFIRMGKGPILCLGGDIPQMWGLPTQLPPCPKPFIWGNAPTLGSSSHTQNLISPSGKKKMNIFLKIKLKYNYTQQQWVSFFKVPPMFIT